MGTWRNLSFMDEWDSEANGPVSQFQGPTRSKVQWRCKVDSRHFWSAQIVARKTSGSGCPVCLNQRIMPGVNDLLTTHPQIGMLLDAKLSGFDASQVTSGNNSKKGYWDCPNHRGFKAFTTTAQLVKRGCPVCSGRQIIPGYNDMQTTQPELMKEWHPTKNDGLDPSQMAAGTATKIWWRCLSDPNHEWQASGDARATSGHGCIYCALQRVIPLRNSLLAQNPGLAKFWSTSKNDLPPSEVYYGSAAKRRWWHCLNGLDHDFQASIPQLIKSPRCSVCENRSLLSGFNDLATRNPDLAREWHPHKNGDLTAHDIFPTSDKKVWWQCLVDPQHEWNAPVRPRHSKGIGCPICGNDWVLKGVNDLATTRPDLVASWAWEKNKNLLPSQVTRRSKKKAWWICTDDPNHTWESTIYARDDGKGCLYCTGQVVQSGVNDLATRFPEVADEWNRQRNVGIEPSDVFARTRKRYWWRCSDHYEHEWQTSVSNRTREHGGGCPYCGGKTLLPGFNDLATRRPDIAELWSYERNTLGPGEVLAGTHRKFWWQCPNIPEHKWFVPVVSLVSGTRCPSCQGTGFDQTQVAILYFIYHPKYLAKKVGITNSNNERSRLAAFERSGWKVNRVVGPMDGHLILELETRLLRWIRRDLGLPAYLSKDTMLATAGWSETFSSEAVSDSEVSRQIDKIMNEIGI